MSKRHTAHLSLICNSLNRQLNMATGCFNTTSFFKISIFIISGLSLKRKKSDDIIATTLIAFKWSFCVGKLIGQNTCSKMGQTVVPTTSMNLKNIILKAKF